MKELDGARFSRKDHRRDTGDDRMTTLLTLSEGRAAWTVCRGQVQHRFGSEKGATRDLNVSIILEPRCNESRHVSPFGMLVLF